MKSLPEESCDFQFPKKKRDLSGLDFDNPKTIKIWGADSFWDFSRIKYFQAYPVQKQIFQLHFLFFQFFVLLIDCI